MNRFLFPYLEYVVDRDHFSPQDEALLFTVLFNRHFEHPKTVKDIIADPNKIRNIDNYDSFANAIKVDESGCVVYKVGNYKYDLPIMGASEPKSSDDLNKDSAWFSAHEAYSKQVSYAIDATELKAGRKLK